MHDDLFGYGYLGLVKAAKKWNGEGNFRGYAAKKIKHSLYDGMRIEMPFSRKLAKKIKNGDADIGFIDIDNIDCANLEWSSEFFDNIQISNIRKHLTAKQKRFLDLLLNGYNETEIAKITKTSRQNIYHHMMGVKLKAKRINSNRNPRDGSIIMY